MSTARARARVLTHARPRTTGRPGLLLIAALTAATACAASEGGATLSRGPARSARSAAPTPNTRAIPAPVPDGPGVLITPSGVVVPVVSRGDDGRWDVTTPCGRDATVAEGDHVPAATIVLDPGHGGSDPGAVSPAGLSERVVNLAVAGYAKGALARAGVSVVLTRTGDYDVELTTRAEMAQALNPRAFVSVHHNAEPDGPWPGPGSETYYQISSPDSKRLAGLIYEEVVRALSHYTVTWVADRDAGAKYRPGRRGDYYAVLRQPAPVVSVLVEFAFISNQPEADLVAQADTQQIEGEALARGIVRYLTTTEPGSGFVEPYPRPDPPPGTGPPTPTPACVDPQL